MKKILVLLFLFNVSTVNSQENVSVMGKDALELIYSLGKLASSKLLAKCTQRTRNRDAECRILKVDVQFASKNIYCSVENIIFDKEDEDTAFENAGAYTDDLSSKIISLKTYNTWIQQANQEALTAKCN